MLWKFKEDIGQEHAEELKSTIGRVKRLICRDPWSLE
jgi:hypothetical protein